MSKKEITIPEAGDSSAKRFRKPGGRDRNPAPALNDEFQNAINTGIKDAEPKDLTPRKLKDKTNIVNNWIENRDKRIEKKEEGPYLSDGEKAELARRRKHVQDTFDDYKWAKRIWGRDTSAKEQIFRDATQSYLQYVRENVVKRLFPENLFSESGKQFVDLDSGPRKMNETSEGADSSVDNRVSVHIGSSRDTLKHLLIEVIRRVESNKDAGLVLPKEEMKKEIYKLSVENDDQTQVPLSITNKQYRQNLLDIPVQEDILTLEDKGYKSYENNNIVEDKYSRRFALNILPDRLKDTVTSMLEEIVPLQYVRMFKVVSNMKDLKRTDKIVIYFYDSEERSNQAELKEKLLRLYANDTQPSHPAMMEPIDPNIQGIAFADQQGTESFTDTRAQLIEGALSEVRVEQPKITLRALEEKVKECFEANNIDPDNPHQYLGKQRGRFITGNPLPNK